MGKSSAPKTPDYAGLAREQSAGDLAMAQYATEANRVNQHTPWGSQTWSNNRTFDQAGYDAAMQSYNQGLSSPQQSQPQMLHLGRYDDSGNPVMEMMPTWQGAAQQQAQQQQAGKAPNADDFWSGGNSWTQNTTLSPQMQALFDQEAALQQGMFGAQNAALARVNQSMGQGFDMSGMPQGGTAMDMSGMPQAPTSYNPGQFGINLNGLPSAGAALDPSQLGAMPEATNFDNLTRMSRALDERTVGGGSVLNQGSLSPLGDVFQGDRGFIDQYDPNRQTNDATQLLLQQMNPELERNRETLRGQLAQQGITQGSEAYNRAMSQFENNRSSAYRDAALQGIGLGMQQQSLQFNQGLSNRQLTAAEQAQRNAQQMANRQQLVGEQGQQFNQGMANSQLGLAAQGQRFQQESFNRQLGAAELQQLYNQQMGIRQQGQGEQSQQFNQQNGLRQQEAGLQFQNTSMGAQQQAQQFAQQQALQQQQAYLQAQQFNQQEAARQRAMQEQAYLRNLPMNELNALRTGNQVSQPTFPGYAQQATTGGPDLVGAAQNTYNANMGATNAGNAGTAGMFGGLMSLGGSFLGSPAGSSMVAGMFSDRRLKEDIRKVGTADNGLTVYAYKYVWGGPTHIGYIAQEVQEKFPEAVSEKNGYLTVDYGKL